jgi:hypothetical protein
MGYGLLADVIVAVHVAYVSYVVLGQLAILVGAACKWNWVRNPWFRWTHFLCIAIVATEAILGITCPLTDWENDLRKLAGQKTSDLSFIGRFLDSVIFVGLEDWVLTSCYIGFAALVLATLWFIPPRRRKRPAA